MSRKTPKAALVVSFSSSKIAEHMEPSFQQPYVMGLFGDDPTADVTPMSQKIEFPNGLTPLNISD